MKNLVTSIELPEGKYRAIKLASTHNNIDKVSRGHLCNEPLVIGGKLILSGGDYEGLITTPIKEMQLLPNAVLITTANSTYRLEEDDSGVYGNGKK